MSTNLSTTGFLRQSLQLFEGRCKIGINQLRGCISNVKGPRTNRRHLEVVKGQGNLFPKNEFQKDPVERKIDDPRVEHGFRHELPNDFEYVRPFTKRKSLSV